MILVTSMPVDSGVTRVSDGSLYVLEAPEVTLEQGCEVVPYNCNGS
jgi:hypothetical protein